MNINKKMAGILGMDIPDEDVETQEVTVVEPHELVDIENADLPPMYDIDRKLLQGDKQLEEVITYALGYQKSLFAEVDTVDPKYRSRYIEVANGTMSLALDAIKTKFKTQETRKKQRLEEAGFVKPNGGGSGDPNDTTNNFFFGSREELITAMKAEQNNE